MPNPNPNPVQTDPINTLRDLLGGGGTGGAAYGVVTTPYGSPAAYTGAFHTGIDIAAAPGTQVHAPIGGTVTKAWFDSIGGNQVAVQTASGFTQVFAHLASFAVTNGQQVAAGDVLGNVGSTGLATGPHIHYEVVKPGGQIGTQAGTVDPLMFLSEFVIPSVAGTPNITLYDANGKPINNPGAPSIGGPTSGQGLGGSENPAQSNFPGAQGAANALDSAGQIAKSLTKLTADLTNPQKWAAWSLSAVAVGLILVGMFIYVRGGGAQQVQQVARV